MARRAWFAAALPLLAASAAGAASPDPRIADWAWEEAGRRGSAPVLVLVGPPADLSEARAAEDLRTRRRVVHALLVDAAERGQAGLRAFLDARATPHRDFFIVSAVALEADRALLREIARRPDVRRIVGDPSIRLDEPRPGATVKAAPWDLEIMGAPRAWAQGFRGQGIVVGVQDTGVRWTHESIRGAYRGWDAASGTASHDYHWHDSLHPGDGGGPCGVDSPLPCDDHGHGTHVTGTVLGTDPAGDGLGVAPGARWIGCRDMDQGVGRPSTYLECFQFFLAPTPAGGVPAAGDPDLAADVTSNSWACPPFEGCAWDVFAEAVAATRTAGIMTVVAAGNSGPGCGSVDAPPAVYGEVFTVGASDSADGVAGFSSRGPAFGTGLVKPDIVAPGVGVRSGTAAADDAYASWSGTSMATPHVAGAVAVIWSARPAYRGRVEETEDLLRRTAVRLSAVPEGCGGDDVNGPNATWGSGRIDLARAIALACAPAELSCTGGFDDDCDGALDCDDPDCAGDAACPEAGHCADLMDNDLNGAVDCSDAACVGDAACPESAGCANGRDDDGDALLDCADPDCAGVAACPEAGNCADGLDNELDGGVDCSDADCTDDAACAGQDFDGDGVANSADCAPQDAGAFAVPSDARDLRVRREPGGFRVSWRVASAGGAGLSAVVASGSLAALRRGGAAGACLGDAGAAGSLLDPRPARATGDWHLARASNACGASSGGWGADSLGRPRAGCP